MASCNHNMEDEVTHWGDEAPVQTGDITLDTDEMAAFIAKGELLLCQLPARSTRSPGQHVIANTIHEICRLCRESFVYRYAEDIYRAISDDYQSRLTLSQIVTSAAVRFPGLVPDCDQMVIERVASRVEKEGREIDQAILVRGLLRCEKSGMHILDTARFASPSARESAMEFRATGCIDLGPVYLERRDRAAFLTINNQYCLNAEDERLVHAMETAVDLALLDPCIRVGVIRGGFMSHPRYLGKRVFSAGINIKALQAGEISLIDFMLRRELGFISKIIRGLLLEGPAIHQKRSGNVLRTIEKPWIVVVDSFAIGGGGQIMLAADHVIAARGSYFSLPASGEGLIPGFANLRLHRGVGCRGSRQVILLGHKIMAEEPDAMLIVDEIVDEGLIDDAINAAIRLLTNPSVSANRHMLAIAEEPPDLFRLYAAEFAVMQAVRMHSRDIID